MFQTQTALSLLPYSWAALVFKKAHTQNAEQLNRFADPFVRDSERHRLAPKHTTTPLYCKSWDSAGSTDFCLTRPTCHRGVPAFMSSLGWSIVLEPSRWGQSRRVQPLVLHTLHKFISDTLIGFVLAKVDC